MALVEDLHDHGAVAQTESAVVVMRARVEGRTDPVVLEEVVRQAGGVGADHGVGLEDEDVGCWGELFVEPGAGEVDVYAVAGREVEGLGDDANVDGARGDRPAEGGASGGGGEDLRWGWDGEGGGEG